MSKRYRSLALVIGCCIAATVVFVSFPSGGSAATLAKWVQIVGPGHTAQIRVITNDAECPTLIAGGQKLPMQVRAKPGPLFLDGTMKDAKFPVLTCEVQAPENQTAVLLEGKSLPLPRLEVHRIVIFGDSGCRMENEDGKERFQNCHDDWPYAKVAQHVAEAKPDLVIHVGDYLYREEACPSDISHCQDSPNGYGWDVWDADFFHPSEPAFAAAPWVMVRGNHEECGRAGEGWFRFLDHATLEPKCRDLSGFFIATLGDLDLVVMDSACTNDPDSDDKKCEQIKDVDRPTLIDTLQRQFAGVAPALSPQAWLLTHRPFNGVRVKKRADRTDNSVQQEAIGHQLRGTVKMIVSGHIHLFEAFGFGGVSPARPAQLVVGTGGDELGDQPKKPLKINDAAVTAALMRKLYGYMVWDRDGATWNGSLFDKDGKPVVRCTLVERDLTCSEIP